MHRSQRAAGAEAAETAADAPAGAGFAAGALGSVSGPFWPQADTAATMHATMTKAAATLLFDLPRMQGFYECTQRKPAAG